MITPFFYKKVDKRSREQMVDYLSTHFRYNTMNSWNLSESWANNMKVHRCIPSVFQANVFEMMETDEFYEEINWLLSDYSENNNHTLQAGFNGRSGGYLVMYEGKVEWKTLFTFEGSNKESDYEDGYGWMGMEEAKRKGLFNKKIRYISSYPGRSVDNYDREDYEGMMLWELVQITEKVQNFDKLCDDIRELTINMAKSFEVVEEEYTVVKTRKVLVLEDS